MEEQIKHAWLTFYVVVTGFVAWTAALAWMNGKKIFWDFDKFPDEHESEKAAEQPKS
jgi:hypothetical protein